MRSKNLPPESSARFKALRAKVSALMDAEGMDHRQRLEFHSMCCAEEATDCDDLDYVEGVIQGWYEDMRDHD